MSVGTHYGKLRLYVTLEQKRASYMPLKLEIALMYCRANQELQ